MICKEVLNYSNTNEMLRILLIVGAYSKLWNKFVLWQRTNLMKKLLASLAITALGITSSCPESGRQAVVVALAVLAEHPVVLGRCGWCLVRRCGSWSSSWRNSSCNSAVAAAVTAVVVAATQDDAATTTTTTTTTDRKYKKIAPRFSGRFLFVLLNPITEYI